MHVYGRNLTIKPWDKLNQVCPQACATACFEVLTRFLEASESYFMLFHCSQKVWLWVAVPGFSYPATLAGESPSRRRNSRTSSCAGARMAHDDPTSRGWSWLPRCVETFGKSMILAWIMVNSSITGDIGYHLGRCDIYILHIWHDITII